jgi:ABC-2 type transport system permease protein
MSAQSRFSFTRFVAIIIKEFIQMKRDRVTFGMMVGIPLIQLTLFGFAINSDPKGLPTAVLMADDGPQARTLLSAFRNSGYFKFVRQIESEKVARDLLAQGDVQFVISIPQGFTRDLLRGTKPSILIEADATDPSATSNAVGAARVLVSTALHDDFKGALAYLATEPNAVDLRIHALYNPEAVSQYNIVPGLMGVVLTMTMVMITSLAITRERERGTMENLLSMPTRPFEVLMGKMIPYVMVGYIQLGLILLAAHFIFHVPMMGNLAVLFIAATAFIVANLAMGITFSTLATNQLQAVQLSFFFFLPSILLSGFMFPFRGMPGWAQVIGEVLPITHFLRIARAVLLKGSGFYEIAPQLWQIFLFAIIALFIGVKRYRQTLD